MLESVQNIFPYMAGAALGLALLLFLVSFRLFRRSRTDVYWRRRRDAGQRGWQLFVLGTTLVVIGGAACLLTVVSGSLFEKNKPSGTKIAGRGTVTPAPSSSPSLAGPVTPSIAAPGLTPTAAVTATPVIVIVTTTPVYTPTETPFPTFTPYLTPLASSVTPPPQAQITITALDDQISDASTPVNPRTTFDAGTKRIYLFVQFKNMAQGVLLTRNLYRDGTLIDGGLYQWGLDPEGTSYFFFGNDTGFEPGHYEIRLYLGSKENGTPASSITFTIR